MYRYALGSLATAGRVIGTKRRDKEQTYVLDQPYEVTKITPPQGKKIKNVILDDW